MYINSTILVIVTCIVLVLLILLVTLIARRKVKAHAVDGYIEDQIYVGNLSYRLNENELRNYFSQYGNIESVRIIRNLKTGKSKGYAFITYFSSKDAGRALKAHGMDFKGRTMVVRIAKEKQFGE